MRYQPWRHENQLIAEIHLDECTKPAEPVLNYIKTYAIYTHERREQNQQNLEFVSCRSLCQRFP